jgi:pyruvate,water dikinase
MLSSFTPADAVRLAPGEYLHAQGQAESSAPSSRPGNDELSEEATALHGLGVCGGVIAARAAVLRDVTEAHRLQPGDVLITRQTDPGWGAVFPLISGLVMERGGMLSHGAIIAREFGIPSVVGIPNATSVVRHGDRVHVNGDLGTLRIEPAATRAAETRAS